MCIKTLWFRSLPKVCVDGLLIFKLRRGDGNSHETLIFYSSTANWWLEIHYYRQGLIWRNVAYESFNVLCLHLRKMDYCLVFMLTIVWNTDKKINVMVIILFHYIPSHYDCMNFAHTKKNKMFCICTSVLAWKEQKPYWFIWSVYTSRGIKM